MENMYDNAAKDIEFVRGELRNLISDPELSAILGDEVVERMQKWDNIIESKMSEPFSLVIIGDRRLTGPEGLRRGCVYQDLGFLLHAEDHIAVFEVQKYAHSQYGKQDHQDHYLEYQPELAMTLNLLGFATSLRGTGRRL